jgi:hypothetical protein
MKNWRMHMTVNPALQQMTLEHWRVNQADRVHALEQEGILDQTIREEVGQAMDQIANLMESGLNILEAREIVYPMLMPETVQ